MERTPVCCGSGQVLPTRPQRQRTPCVQDVHSSSSASATWSTPRVGKAHRTETRVIGVQNGPCTQTGVPPRAGDPSSVWNSIGSLALADNDTTGLGPGGASAGSASHQTDPKRAWHQNGTVTHCRVLPGGDPLPGTTRRGQALNRR